MNYGGSETQNTHWVLESLQNKKNGYFIDIGCNQPKYGNNTYVLEKNFSWNGIVVEPNPQHFNDIQNMRTCTKILGRPIFDHNDFVDFMIIENTGLDGYSGIDETQNIHHRKMIVHQGVSKQPKFKIVKLQAMCPKTLVKEYSVPNIFDYLKIDVEGAELKIIQNWPWDKARPTLVSIESDPETTAKSVIKCMTEVNYKQVENSHCNVNYEFFFQSLLTN